MQAKYIPTRKIGSTVSLGMNPPADGKRFGRLGGAFRRDSAYWGERGAWYIVAAVNRDSGILDRAKFSALLAMLGGENGETVAIERARHWACGWVDYLVVHPRHRQGLRLAILAHSAVSEDPILDDEIYSNMEDDECRETWENCYDARDRVQYFREHSHSGKFRQLRAAVAGDWHEAANALHCPSDILA